MHPMFRTASADESTRTYDGARNEEARAQESEDDAKARQRAIIDTQLAKKKGGGQAHGPQHDHEGKPSKNKGAFSVPPTRPGQRGRRG